MKPSLESDLSLVARRILESCRRQKATDADVWIDRSSREIFFRDAFRTIDRTHHDTEIGLRFGAGPKIGYAECNQADSKSLDALVEQAQKASRRAARTTELLFNTGGPPDRSTPSRTVFEAVRSWIDSGQIPSTGRLQLECRTNDVFYANSFGFSAGYTGQVCRLYIEDRTDGASLRFFWAAKSLADLPNIGDALVGIRRWLDLPFQRRIIPSGARPIVMINQIIGRLFEIVGHVFNGKSPGISGTRGPRIAGDCLTITDEPWVPFDGEGTPTAKRTVVKKGRLVGPFYDLQLARMAGVLPTGNAQRVNPSEIEIGPHRLVVEPGRASLSDIIGGVESGYVITGLRDARYDLQSGSVVVPAEAVAIEAGRPVHRVGTIFLRLMAEEVLKKISVVANDPVEQEDCSAPSLRMDDVEISASGSLS